MKFIGIFLVNRMLSEPIDCDRMSKSAAEILKKFYLQLRGYNISADSTPITARQLESLVRLAEARARLELREEIIAEDALVSALSSSIRKRTLLSF